jgi:O-antigen ligase
VFALATLTGPLPRLGVVAVLALAGIAVVARERTTRAPAIAGALVLAPALLLAEIWSSPQLRVVHRHPLVAAVGVVIALAVLAAAATAFTRRPSLVAPLALLALPFRVPIESGGTTSNLLVPLYLVVAAAALAELGRASVQTRRERAARRRAADLPRRRERGGVAPASPVGSLRARLTRGTSAVDWMQRLVAAYLILYGAQAVYSSSAGFEKALQNAVFFYVPFALLYVLLRDVAWTSRLIRFCLVLTALLAIAFSLIGFAEYATKTIILNPRLVVTNDLHTYFTVNSVFFDPDIFGRYLALVMILLSVLLIYERPQREQATVVVVLAVLWACLVLTLSRSSLGALLVGLAALAALRWRPSRALVAVVVVVGLGAAAVAVSPTTFGLNQGINGASSGRGGLVSGGLSLFAERPLWGYGSGSFAVEYQAHHRTTASGLSDSHTIPITIAAEQGLIGELVYLAFVLSAVFVLVRGARGDPVRSAIAAAFVALLFHTLLYADFLEDPSTWTLLGIGVGLWSAAPAAPPPLAAAAPGIAA